MTKGKSSAWPDGQFDPSDGSRVMLDHIFDFYGTLDKDGRVIDLAGRIFAATHTNPELLTDNVFAETVFWQSSEGTSKQIKTAINDAIKGSFSRLLLDFRLGADDKKKMEVFVHPREDVEGDPIIFICGRSVLPMIDQSIAGSHVAEQFLMAAENAKIGMWHWDFTHRVIHATPHCNELFGLPGYGSFQYEQYREAIHPDDRDFVDDFLRTSRLRGSKYEEEFRVVYADGTIEWLCAEGKSLLDEKGDPALMTGVVRKITEQKYAAAELAKVHALEKKARAEAVEANRSKDFFLAFVSHELRSPLNAILGWSRILLAKEVDDTVKRNALETIERSARIQTKLINDLVDSARVASGKLRLEYRQTNLFDIVRNSYQAQKPAAESKDISFDFISDIQEIPMFGDSNRLQQVFGNLLSNAIKFTPEGGQISIELTKEGETASVTVSDSGAGIPRSALPLIFKQFSQGDIDQSRQNIGLGLGLSIVKILVEKHGGTVEGFSEGIGHGSKFVVKLPLTSEPIKPEPLVNSAKPAAVRRLEGVRILIVEDDPDSREVLQLFLEQNGANIKAADSAKIGFSIFSDESSERPDVLISDLGMPEEDGYSFISRIRQLGSDKGGDVPAMALSAFASSESRLKAFESGFDRYQTKPFEPDSIVDQIISMLDGQKGEEPTSPPSV